MYERIEYVVTLFGDEIAHCNRCGYELSGREHTCPQCQYSPRSRGLRVALGFLMAMVVLMTITMFLPQFGALLVSLAGLSFILTFGMFIVSFLATPSSRIGALFLRF